MSTERDALHEKLVHFFERYDPARLDHGIDAVVDFGLSEGIQALNSALMDRYGAYLGSDGQEAFGAADLQALRSRIELFYLKHSSAKLDSPSDVDAIVAWTAANGLDMLSDKLARKFGEGVEDVTEEDVLVQLQAFYERHDPQKTTEDIRTVLQWGLVNSFTALNQKMVEKYGEGLGAIDRAKVREEIQSKLTTFYMGNAPERLDPENLEFVVEFALKKGTHELNKRLQAKYGCNMNTIMRDPPSPGRMSQRAGRPASRAKSMRNSVRKSIASLTKGPTTPEAAREAAEAQVNADLAYQEYLRKLVEIFYARHDPNRLLEEGVTPIINYAIKQGESALNAKLRAKYSEDLVDVDKEFQAMREELIRFYSRFDPSKLEPENEAALDTVTGWALVNGRERLNETLRSKYDDDLDASGLKARLRLFYGAVGHPKSESDIADIVDWCYENSVDALNKKLKKRYGKSLVDTTFAEEPELPPPLPPLDDVPAMPAPKPSKKKKYKKKAPLPSGPPPTPPKPSDFATLPEEHERSDTHAALEAKLLKFYRKKDPAKANPDQTSADARKILRDGIDKFNGELMRLYGESLVSLDKGRQQFTMKRQSISPVDKV